jgi:predicted regulator of Ras-like GTPase activity (Roadblock/LC7/MglB family)
VQDRLNRIVGQVTRENVEVIAALVVDSEGRVEASDGASADLVQAAIAFALPLRDLLERSSAELGCGLLRGTLVEGDAASFALADVDGGRTAILVGTSGAAPGPLRSDCFWLAEQLRQTAGLS